MDAIRTIELYLVSFCSRRYHSLLQEQEKHQTRSLGGAGDVCEYDEYRMEYDGWRVEGERGRMR